MITIQDLSVSLGGKEILKNLSFTLEEGESFVILGSSGSGKTVLLRTLAGLIRPYTGTIEIFGNNIARMTRDEKRALRERTAMVFQSSALFDSMTVWENVGFYLIEHSDLSFSEIRRRADEVLREVGLEDVLDLKPEELSGGMKKRVGIARALIGEPKVLFYDEPTAGLDPLTSQSIIRLIAELHKKHYTTELLVTHDLEIAKKVADRIAVLNRGEIQALGTWKSLVESEHPFVQKFIRAGGLYEEICGQS